MYNQPAVEWEVVHKMASKAHASRRAQLLALHGAAAFALPAAVYLGDGRRICRNAVGMCVYFNKLVLHFAQHPQRLGFCFRILKSPAKIKFCKNTFCVWKPDPSSQDNNLHIDLRILGGAPQARSRGSPLFCVLV